MTTKELREKRAQLAEQAASILKKAHDDKREVLKPEEEQEWQRLHDDIDALKRHVDKLERQAEIDKQLADPQPRVIDPAPIRADDRPGSSAAMRRLQMGQEDATRALRAWFLASPTSGYALTEEDRAVAQRVGINLLSKQLDLRFSSLPMRSLAERREWEYRAQGVATGGAGGFVVPDEVMRALEISLLTFGGMRARCTIIRTEGGAAMPWPTVNDTAQAGVLLAENVAAAEQDVTFAQLVLDAYKYSSKLIRVSAEFLQDASINVGAVLGELLGTRIGRITNTHFTTGTGTAQPNGIVTATGAGFTAPNADSQVTTWKYSSIVETEHSVDPAYRFGAAWMMHDSSIKKTKLIVDTTGRPIWAAGIAGMAPDTLMGYPIVVNQDIAVMAANAKSVLFGDLSKYLIRDVLGITLLRLEERYAEFHQVAFLAFSRHDADLLNAGTAPVKQFVNAAS
jgi:HK97 family phage major capsid protein